MIVWRIYLDGLDGEGFFGVLGEHGDNYVIHDFGFGSVGGGNVDKDITSFDADLRMV